MIPDFTQEDLTEIRQAIPQDPVCVTTVLFEDEVGNIRPFITDEDGEWAMDEEARLLGH